MSNHKTLAVLAIPALSFVVLHSQTPPPGSASSGAEFPDGPGKEITQKVCGATCHGPDIVMGSGRTREQWADVVNAMMARGAKASETELMQIANYLSTKFGPNLVVTAPPQRAAGRGPGSAGGPPRGPGPLGAGAADSHIVDAQGAERGKMVYIAECITCHGNKARGPNAEMPPGQQGADLVRSLTILHDRYGNTLGPFLAKGHPLQSSKPSASLTPQQVGDLAHFLHQKVFDTLRGGPTMKVQNVLTGDPRAGAAYFNGAGKCRSCHSPTGDLARIGSRYDPETLQTKFLFPRTVGFGRPGAGTTTAKPIMVTVTRSSGEVIQGVLDKLDDFNVSLRDSEGEYRSFKRTASLKVEKQDPYAMHVALLDQYTDKNIHDIVAYLETLK